MIEILESIADHLDVDMKGLALIIVTLVAILGILALAILLYYSWLINLVRGGSVL